MLVKNILNKMPIARGFLKDKNLVTLNETQMSQIGAGAQNLIDRMPMGSNTAKAAKSVLSRIPALLQNGWRRGIK